MWKNKVLNDAQKQGLNNVLIYSVEKKSRNFREDYIKQISLLEDESLDFVLVDGVLRDLSTLVSIPKIKTGGLLIIDNFQRYLPSKSISPFAIDINGKPLNELWESIEDLYLSKWKKIHTSNGVNDTVIFFKS